MAISRQEQKLLSTFPRPPPGPPTPSPKLTTVSSAQPTAVHRPTDFGFIHVALDDAVNDEDDDDSFAPPAPALQHHRTVDYNVAGGLQLVLDDPNRLFAPGEPITGYISGWDDTARIHIILEGRANACLDVENIHSHTSARFNTRAILLYHITHLQPEDQRVVPRFSITIPERTQQARDQLKYLPKDPFLSSGYWPYDWPQDDSFAHDTGHPLPSSLSFSDTHTEFTTRTQGLCSISYSLVAIRSHVSSGSNTLEPDAHCSIPIHLTTLRIPAEKLNSLTTTRSTSTSNLSVRTSQLSRDGRVSLYSHVRDSFSSATPAFYFAPSVSVPKACTPGASMGIRISVNVLPPPPGKLYNFPVPDVTIISFEYRIRSYTGLRVPRLFPNPVKAHTFKYILVHKRLGERDIKKTFTPKEGAYDGQTCWVETNVPKRAVPSFKTLHAWRGYRVDCELGIRVAGKEVWTKTGCDLNVVTGMRGQETEYGVNSTTLRQTDQEHVDLSVKMAEAMVRDVGL